MGGGSYSERPVGFPILLILISFSHIIDKLSTFDRFIDLLLTDYLTIIDFKKILTKSISCFFWACLSSLLLHASLIFDLRKSAWNIEDCSEANIILWFVYSSVLEPHLGHFYPWNSQSLQNLRQNGLEKVKNTINLPKGEIMILCPESRSLCRLDPSQQPQLSCLSQLAPPTVESFTHCAWRGEVFIIQGDLFNWDPLKFTSMEKS